MQYLDASEYVAFGLSDETGDDLVTAASALIDSYCKRPSLGIMQYVERMRLKRRNSVQLSNMPLASADGVTSPLVLIRARTSHRSNGGEDRYAFAMDANVLVTADTWVTVDPATVDVASDGVLSIAPHLFGTSYSEVEVTYTAGYAAIPIPVKIACAQIVRNAQAMPALNIRRQAMDSMQMEYFSNTLLDADVQRLLQPYQSQRMG
jgi:hypothetical protein